MKAYIDRFEKDRAVLIFEELKESVVLPRKLLPSNCQEGDILTISVKIEKSRLKKEKQRIKKLQSSLSKKKKD